MQTASFNAFPHRAALSTRQSVRSKALEEGSQRGHVTNTRALQDRSLAKQPYRYFHVRQLIYAVRGITETR